MTYFAKRAFPRRRNNAAGSTRPLPPVIAIALKRVCGLRNARGADDRLCVQRAHPAGTGQTLLQTHDAPEGRCPRSLLNAGNPEAGCADEAALMTLHHGPVLAPSLAAEIALEELVALRGLVVHGQRYRVPAITARSGSKRAATGCWAGRPDPEYPPLHLAMNSPRLVTSQARYIAFT